MIHQSMTLYNSTKGQNIMGPSTDPWGTPKDNDVGCEIALPIETFCVPLDIKDENLSVECHICPEISP